MHAHSSQNSQNPKRAVAEPRARFNKRLYKNQNRKGLPQKYCPYKIIEDEEFLLSQTPQKQKPVAAGSGHFNQMMYANGQGVHSKERQIHSPRVQSWFNCEYFYSQMDKAYFSANSFEKHLQVCGVGAARLSTKEWAVVRLALRRQLSGAEDYQKRRFIFSEEFVRKE